MTEPAEKAAKVKKRPKAPGRGIPHDYGQRSDQSGVLCGTMHRIFKENAPPTEHLFLPENRSAATKNNTKINLKAVAEVLAEKGLDPVSALVDIVKSGKLDLEVQVRVLSTLTEYVHSKKKSVEITGADGGAIQVENVSDDVLLKIAMQALPQADVIDV